MPSKCDRTAPGAPRHPAALPILILTSLLLAGLAACGDGVVVVLRSSSGVVADDPFCGNGNGEFRVREADGLLVLIVIDTRTSFFRVDGSFGTCRDLGSGARVDVRGPDEGGAILAREVRLR